ncbi:MAG: hypothetical protein ACO2ZV_08405 [Ilumatobacteraceae bacterium]|jgi:hypothetical protein
MDSNSNPNEDWRGVDIGQIRSQLKLSVKDRVRDMVQAANVMMSIVERARVAREHTTQDELRRQEEG